MRRSFKKYEDMLNKVIAELTEDQSKLLKGNAAPVVIADQIKELEQIKDEIRNIINNENFEEQ